MPRSLKPMLFRWPELYPELTGAGEPDNDPTGEVERIREEVLAPILESRDIASTFRKSREAYRVWKESRSSEATDLEVVLAKEDRLDEKPRTHHPGTPGRPGRKGYQGDSGGGKTPENRQTIRHPSPAYMARGVVGPDRKPHGQLGAVPGGNPPISHHRGRGPGKAGDPGRLGISVRPERVLLAPARTAGTR